MNKICATLGLIWGLLISPQYAQSQCQLCYLPEDVAQRVVRFLEAEREFVIYCQFTTPVKDIARRIKVESVKMRPAPREGLMEIVVKGTLIGTFDIENNKVINYVKNDLKIEEAIDISYLHIRTGGYYDKNLGRNIWDSACLGLYLGLECEPWIDPFDYPHQ